VVFFQFSKPVPLAPANEFQRALSIPLKATKFAVAFPLGGVGHLNPEHKDNLAFADASFMFLLYGGIIYFDETDEIVGASGFLPFGSEIKFEERKRWDNQFTPQLHKAR
jgi:hypothetical protein